MPTVQLEAVPLPEIVSCDAPFDEALEAVLDTGARMITAEQLAVARIQAQDPTHSVSANGSYVREGSLFVPNGAGVRRIVLGESLVLRAPKDATEAHLKGREYFLGDDFVVEDFLESLGKDEYFIVNDMRPVPFSRYGESGLMTFLYRGHAKDYGLFLKDTLKKDGQSDVYLNNDAAYIDSQTGPFVNQLWVSRLGGCSVVGGCDRYLNVRNRVRGVRVNPAEGGTQKISSQETGDLYSPQQFLAAAAGIGLTITGDLEKRLTEKLGQTQ